MDDKLHRNKKAIRIKIKICTYAISKKYHEIKKKSLSFG